jgi:Uma2 family endonuclease
VSIQPGLLTAEEFAALPSEGLRLELIRGEMRAMPPAFADHGDTVGALHVILGSYIRAQRLGKIYGAETGFLLARNPDTVRAPDIAFIQASHLTPEASAPNWNPVVPDLAVEVVSSRDREREIADKVAMWLDAGVRLVWVVYRVRRAIEVFEPGQPMSLLTEQDALDGLDVVPGFSVPVADIFAE